MSKPAQSAPEAMLTAMRRFSRASFTRSQAVSSGELSRADWYLLWLLQSWPDPKGARPSELARQQQVTAGSVAQQLRNLQTQGLVLRLHDEADRRVILVRLTAPGKQKLKRLRNEFVEHFEQLIEHMGADDTEHLIRLLTAAADFLETKDASSC